MTVVHASALLAFLHGEPGAEVAESVLTSGAVCSAANWSEVAQQVRSRDRDWDLARALLLSYGIVVEPVSLDDAEYAAALWRRGSGLSLGDRLCLALASRLGYEVVTADRAWASIPGVRLLR